MSLLFLLLGHRSLCSSLGLGGVFFDTTKQHQMRQTGRDQAKMVVRTLEITNLPVLRNTLVASVLKACGKSPGLLSLITLIEFVNPSRIEKIATKDCPSPKD